RSPRPSGTTSGAGPPRPAVQRSDRAFVMVPTGSRRRQRYRSPASRDRTTRHGEPNATTLDGTSRTTTDPAPITVCSPIVRPWSTTAPIERIVQAPTLTFPPVVAPGDIDAASPRWE